MLSDETFCLEISGDYACFTRPEMKVERVSYDVMTPSSARGVFEAVLWKPALSWQITKIEVLRPIRWISVRRNELSVVSRAFIGVSRVFIEDSRTQRAGLFLRDVAYRIHARFELRDDGSHTHYYPDLRCCDGEQGNTFPKFAEMFKRRAGRGQCFNQPYLGTREFSADFRLVEPGSVGADDKPIAETRDLGWMLYDINFNTGSKGDSLPMFFQAQLRDGVIDVPSLDSGKIRQ